MSVLGKTATTGFKVMATGVAAAATGVAALSTAAVKAYADYEQLVGGVETLFGAGGKSLEEYALSVGKSLKEASSVQGEYNELLIAQNTVLDNANNAYKNAGMSANQYMETVTSFAASLKQSTANELEAAKVADQAIIDMADNANKMGTSMEMIQNAYQGFAKQNYTMLDNLKLGYGGTKEEMQRLLSDATALSGIEYDISSLADVYEAIHVIQEELGIAGTTVKEASTTISGSLGMVKAAWSNLLVSMAEGGDISGNIDALVESAGVAFENLLPVIETSIGGVGQLIETVLPITVERIPTIISDVLPGLLTSGVNIITTLLEGISSSIPQMAEGAKSIISTLGQGITEALPDIISSVSEIVTQIYEIIVSEGPALLESGYTLLSDLVSGFVEGIPEVLPKVLDFVQGIGDYLAEAAPVLIEKGFEMLSMLVDGIVSAIPILVEKVPEIISTFANIINDNAPTILAKGVELVWQLVQGIISAIPVIVANIPQILQAIWDLFVAFQWTALGGNIMTAFSNGIKSMGGMVKGAGESILNAIVNIIKNLPQLLANLGKSSVNLLSSGISGLAGLARSAATTIFNAILTILKSLPSKLIELGKQAIKGLLDGIVGNIGAVIDGIGKAASGIVNKVKGVFKINSPSKEFRYIGEMCVAGFDVGTEDFEDSTKEMEKTANDLTKHIKASMGTLSANTSVSRQENLYAHMNSNVNVHLEGDAKGLFKAVRTESDIYKKQTGESAFAY